MSGWLAQWVNVRNVALVLVACLSLLALAGVPIGASRGGGEALLLAINDVYRIEGVDRRQAGGLARVRALRRELERGHPDLVMLLAGDFLAPSLLSDMLHGEQMVDVLNVLDGRAGIHDPRFLVAFGNHEFDTDGSVGEERLIQRIEQAEFSWLASDIVFARSFPTDRLRRARRLIDDTLIESGGLRIGIFSLMIDVEASYVDSLRDRRTVACQRTAALRERGADVVVALTHLPMKEDLEILSLGADGPDLILGGHDHTRHAQEIDGRWLVKADAEARSATVVRIRKEPDRPPTITIGFRLLRDEEVQEDPRVAAKVAGWLECHQETVCGGDAGCLEHELAEADVPLIAEEDEIRRFETNLGNWIADQMRDEAQADVAFVNSGLLRLNYDLPRGPITERELRELVAYADTRLVKIPITEDILKKVADRAVEHWDGSGHFLQVSGFAFRHDPKIHRVTEVMLIEETNGEAKLVPFPPGKTLEAVTVGYLAKGEDGYDFLKDLEEIDPPRTDAEKEARLLRPLLARRLQDQKRIAPRVVGRICNTERPARCPLWPSAADGAVQQASRL